MTKNVMIVLVGLTLGVACATQVSIAPTDLENVTSEARVLAIEARNFAGVARGRTDVSDSLAQSIAEFNVAAEDFAGETARATSQDEIDVRFQKLIRAWVNVKLTFPQIKVEGPLKDSYDKVAEEWEKLERASGYAGKKYEQKYGTK